MQTKIWITGASGRIGKILLQQLDRTENKILATDTDVDVADLESVKSYCDMNRPMVHRLFCKLWAALPNPIRSVHRRSFSCSKESRAYA